MFRRPRTIRPNGRVSLVACFCLLAGCGPATQGPAGDRTASAPEGSGTPPEPAVSTQELCKLMSALWKCHADSLPEPEREKTTQQRAMIQRLIMKMPPAVQREACESTAVNFALQHAANPGVMRCVQAWRVNKPPFTTTCLRVVEGIRCLQRKTSADERPLVERSLAEWQQKWRLLPGEVQSSLCRTHWLRFQAQLAPDALASCRPSDPSLREPPMPPLPANLPAECAAYVKTFRCILGVVEGGILWDLRTELRQELTRWQHVDRAMLPRMCQINGFMLKERLQRAKLEGRCPAP